MKKVNGRAEMINRPVSFKPGEVLPFPCLDDGKVVFLFYSHSVLNKVSVFSG